jgi:hypothetical protein
LAGFLKVGVERTLIRTTISTQPGVPRTISVADCRKLIPGPKSRSQRPTKGLRRRSDAEVGDDVDDSEGRYKRQTKDDYTEVMAHEASDGTEASEGITTPAVTEHINVLRMFGLEKSVCAPIRRRNGWKK